jgi:tRNA(Ile)-lysidine synthase
VIAPEGEKLLICREPGRLRAAPLTLGSGETAIWDRRFRVTCGALPRPLCIDALGERNLAALPQVVRKQHPAPALASLPALYAEGHLLGVPVAGFAVAEQHPDAMACTAEFIWHSSGTGHA